MDKSRVHALNPEPDNGWVPPQVAKMWRHFAEAQLAQAANLREARVAANRLLDIGQVTVLDGGEVAEGLPTYLCA